MGPGSLVRELAGVYRPRLKVDGTFGIRHPLLWGEVVPDAVFRADIDYPRPHEGLQIPDEQVSYAASLFIKIWSLRFRWSGRSRGVIISISRPVAPVTASPNSTMTVMV